VLEVVHDKGRYLVILGVASVIWARSACCHNATMRCVAPIRKNWRMNDLTSATERCNDKVSLIGSVSLSYDDSK